MLERKIDMHLTVMTFSLNFLYHLAIMRMLLQENIVLSKIEFMISEILLLFFFVFFFDKKILNSKAYTEALVKCTVTFSTLHHFSLKLVTKSANYKTTKYMFMSTDDS